ncbi:bifunctional aminotransferase class I/II-fold pyridoxal phosphate-dependent enzyme/GNAT family N-acetyltransferase [Maribacter polysaccharolyticus]|uniref:bifunctional aminotransferase class I/II-fold pyridoxal phosphate-dependent enzyme/GNAT family N-acetyltransferase n=1 Tax=Maribacter polysaccharolyticus TaxID=3020831 RepID=UPI00237F9D76|nr:bifunctional aminotransferase class I/II-fold pyridoxal phosphate-dependent enzyme/GNAT family N-acetyltransferase [Maribacter polysaccharolyticus]MDE3741155.1 bifunctional aminotransferase class I/II-fold pyridoxal phosphate-dependent enzyme/GNAT family N-acetyltransferase [Maribacter polysaccharolyticus]
MAKIKHHNFLNTVHEVFTDAKQEGVLHLYAEGDSFSGRKIKVKNRDLFHFGTTGYLGLEQDHRLKRAAIQAIENYGTQFPLSKSYISNPLYKELEELVTQMYQAPIIITKNSTLGHLGVIPSAVDDDDVIILDHQVHWSVQNAAKMLKTRSVPIEMIRHNNLEMLEDKLKKYTHSKKHIWYMADGIYSMYGDFAPVNDLMELGKKYPQLRFYFDDVHGMSWVGQNGTGYVLSQLGELPPNVLLFGTLSKTFGASGALLACSDSELYKKIKTFGGPLTFSAQLEPASVAAAIASAKIHLSADIYVLQDELKERIDYFNEFLAKTYLPLIDHNESPVFYIGTGMPKTGYNFVNRLMKEGFYVNLGIFPAVPVKNTGVRITISRHNHKEEIKALVAAMEYHYPKALEDTRTTPERVFHAFDLQPKVLSGKVVNVDLQIDMMETIEEVDKNQWNNLMIGKGVYDWDGLKFLENVFQGNTRKEFNWDFRYVFIKDGNDKIILATFLTHTLWKDDMLANENVSRAIEAERNDDPYHLTSMVVSMGSLFTEGDHMYWDGKHPKANAAMDSLIRLLEDLQHDLGAKMIVLRDFERGTPWHRNLQGNGFVRVQMPNSCVVDLKGVVNLKDYLAKLSSRNRKHYRKDIRPNLDKVKVNIAKKATPSEIAQIKKLYGNVHRNNQGLNTFSFPEKLFDHMDEHPQWEFIMIRPSDQPETVIGVMLCYKNPGQVYVPAFIGMDYDYLTEFSTYRLLLLMTIEQAIALGYSKIDMGMTASFEKKKLGAQVIEKYAYLQTADNYNLELLGIMEGQ